MKKFLTILSLAALFGCASTYQPPVTSTKPAYVYDQGIAFTEIKGLRVGMSPRRVLQEFNQQDWKYSTTSTVTLEDVIERGIEDEHLYISTNDSILSNLTVFFMDSQVFRISESYSVSDQELEAAVSGAKDILASLGEFSERRKDNHLILEYRPSKSSHVYYDFYKDFSILKYYNVSHTVTDLKQ